MITDIPATAQQALDAGAMYVVCASLTLPAAQSADGSGAPWRWTAGQRNVLHETRTYLADKTVRNVEYSTSGQQAEGRVALVLFDSERLWEKRLVAAGTRGNAVELLCLLPHGNKLWWEMSRFDGATESIEPLTDPRDGRVLRLLVEDAVYQAKIVRGEYATDGHQKALSAEAGQTPYDNSHAAAHLARQKRWHRR